MDISNLLQSLNILIAHMSTYVNYKMQVHQALRGKECRVYLHKEPLTALRGVVLSVTEGGVLMRTEAKNEIKFIPVNCIESIRTEGTL